MLHAAEGDLGQRTRLSKQPALRPGFRIAEMMFYESSNKRPCALFISKMELAWENTVRFLSSRVNASMPHLHGPTLLAHRANG